MGTWPIYKKHFLQLILTKKTLSFDKIPPRDFYFFPFLFNLYLSLLWLGSLNIEWVCLQVQFILKKLQCIVGLCNQFKFPTFPKLTNSPLQTHNGKQIACCSETVKESSLSQIYGPSYLTINHPLCQ